MNVLVTDALTSDLLAITPGLERDLQAKYEKAARYDEQQKGGRQVALQMMHGGYGPNFEVGVFPDVSSEDAVFQSAKWSVKLAKAT